MTGLFIAAAVGAIGGDPWGKLEVLKNLTPAQVVKAQHLVAQGRVQVMVADVPHVLYSEAKVMHGEEWVTVAIADTHTQVVRIEENGKVVFETELEDYVANAMEDKSTIAGIQARDVFDFAMGVPLEMIRFIHEAAELNTSLSREGMSGQYGLHIGTAMDRQRQQGLLADGLLTQVLMRTTAASDARMGGAALPAMTNSGSGNQGIAATMPVVVVAEYVKANEESLIRALMLSHMMAIYIHDKLPKLSALCAVTTASMGAAAGMAWLLKEDFRVVSMAISNMIGDLAGLICDGASNSCAMKVSTSVMSGYKAVLLALEGIRVTGNDGIVAEDVDQSIANLGVLACQGMAQMDEQILQIMLNKK